MKGGLVFGASMIRCRPKRPRTVDRASPHSSSSSSSVAVPIRIIAAGPTSRGRVFHRYRVVDPRALLLGHGTARWTRPTIRRRSIIEDRESFTRRRPRASLVSVSSIRATSSRTTHHPVNCGGVKARRGDLFEVAYYTPARAFTPRFVPAIFDRWESRCAGASS